MCIFQHVTIPHSILMAKSYGCMRDVFTICGKITQCFNLPNQDLLPMLMAIRITYNS